MNRRYRVAALTMMVLLVSLAAHAARRRRASFHPAAGHNVGVVFVQGLNIAAARTEAYRIENRLILCIRGSQPEHGALLGQIEHARVIVHLRPNGTASHVEIVPATLPTTFSACLADPFLDWQQQGPINKHPEVHLALRLVL